MLGRPPVVEEGIYMGFLGMGPMELTVILVVALIIFGPDKLPEMAGKAGRILRDFKKMSGDLTSEFENSVGMNDIKRTVQQELGGIQATVNSTASSVKKEVKGAGNTISSAGKATAKKTGMASTTSSTATKSTSTASPAAASAAAKKTSTAAKPNLPAPKPVASKSDPYADVSFLDNDGPVAAKAAAKAVTPAAPVLPSSSALKTAAAAPVLGEDQDPLSRARVRRINAGYSTQRSA